MQTGMGARRVMIMTPHDDHHAAGTAGRNMAHGDRRSTKRCVGSGSGPWSAKDMPPHIRWLLPRLLLSTIILGVSTPVEIAVPLVRTAQDKRGVQSGPAIGSLVSVATGLALVDRVERHPDSSVPGERSFTAALIGGALLPAAAAALPVTVVLRGRSPLWGWALWISVRLTTAFVLAVGVARAKRRLDAAIP